MSRLLLFVLQAIAFQSAYSQCVNRVLNGCAPNVVETILPNQYIIGPQGVPMLPTLAPPAPLLPSYPPPLLPVAQSCPEPYSYPTVVQDSSVANSLANALQLLVVSNLLSSTLPGACELPGYPVESVMPMPALPGLPYNYLY